MQGVYEDPKIPDQLDKTLHNVTAIESIAEQYHSNDTAGGKPHFEELFKEVEARKTKLAANEITLGYNSSADRRKFMQDMKNPDYKDPDDNHINPY